jgi:hypothetical protein
MQSPILTRMPRARLACFSMLLVAFAGCTSSPAPTPEPVGHVSAASINERFADNVFGQPDFVTGTEPALVSITTARRPAGLAVGALLGQYTITVADRGNHRARCLIGSTLLPTPTPFVLGQTSFDLGEPNQGLGPSYNTLSGPTAVAQSNDTRYAVADTDNHRVMVGYYFSGPSWVVGQRFSFSTAERNKGGLSGATLAEPKGVTWWNGSAGNRLWIADSGNHRLVAYTDPSFSSAAFVLGQHDTTGADSFVRNQPNDGRATPGSATLRDPRGLSGALSDFGGVPSTGMFVADTGNHRVLHFSECTGFESSRPCANADLVIGQKDFNSADPSAGGVSAFSLHTPTAVAMDRRGGVWVADTGHNRVLHFPRSKTVADRVLGQPDFVTAAPPTVISNTTLSAPTGVAVDQNDDLYVADTGANRILRFKFIPTAVSCNDGDPCTNDSVSTTTPPRCRNDLVALSTECFPYACDTVRHVCASTCSTAGTPGGPPGVSLPCQSPFTCTTAGKCVERCASFDAICRDGRQCVDGYCCDASCRGTCEACNVAGKEGTCSSFKGPPVNAGGTSPRRVCARAGVDDPECAGQCNGSDRDACVAAGITTACGPETCNDGVATLRGTCDGKGRCVYVTKACAPYACAPNGCRADCTAPHHCVAGADCVAGQCVPLRDQQIGGVGCNVRDDGGSRDDHASSFIVALGALGGVALFRRRRGRR